MTKLKKLLATLSAVILIVCSVAVPYSVLATTGTLGTENPKLTAVFTNSDNEQVDGNALVAGEYTVDISLSGVSSVSVFQLTATTTSDITINSTTTIADSDTSFSCGSIVNDGSNFVAILASENDDTSAIDSTGTTMVSMKVSVTTDGDFADYFKVSTDPNLTFVEVDYGDGYDDAYVCSENTTSDYNTLTYDMSPETKAATFDVKGQITISTDTTGSSGSVGVSGITVSVKDSDISATTDSDGNYTLSGLEEGEYTLSIAGSTTVDRTVTLTVAADKATDGTISVSAVPVVICDYNHDGYINVVDMTSFNGAYGSDVGTNIYCNFNGDGYVNVVDMTAFNSFYGQTIAYDSVAL